MSRLALERPLRLVGLEGIGALAGLAAVHWPLLRGVAAPFLPVFPYVVLAGGLLLGLRFGRGRLWYALLVLALADRALLVLEPGTAAAGTAAVLIPLLLPLNFLVFTLVPEDGPLGPRGRLLGAAVAAEAALVALVIYLHPEGLAAAFSRPWIPVPPGEGGPVPQLAWLAFTAAVITLGIRAVQTPDSTPRGLLWAAIAALVALHADAASVRTLDLSAAGLALGIAMVEASHALAFRDELTGLPSRRAFDQALARLSGQYVVAMVDVDHFKGFNDRYGHEVGDQVLRMVAGRLAGVGGGGRAFRYGGEEFAVLFPDTLADDAEPHLEALRASIESAAFTLRSADRPRKTPSKPRRTRSSRRDLSVTVSIGSAAPSSREAEPHEVVQAADKALYRAKHGGRNRVVSGS